MNFRDFATTTILLVLVAGLQFASGNQEPIARDNGSVYLEDYRLPKAIIPVNYEIMLMPRLSDDFGFNGIVRIKAMVQEPTDTVVLHKGSIVITKATVTNLLNNQDVNVQNPPVYNNVTEKYALKLEETLAKGMNISLNFEYNGKLRDDMIGFYRSSYIDAEGKIRWIASTQFQTAHARHAFPCFDEPSFKATFVLRILRSPEYNCLSNMPIRNTIPGTQIWDEFEQSIPMSTYLVAFTISDFKSYKTGNFSVWARPNAIEQARYALDVGPRGLQSLSSFFKQDYQLPKMDMVAVPDFSAGAMENWGLITYRETRFLRDEGSTSDAVTQSIASVIVHELTHMWFGNMVTPEWWSYLWLSEAFARYFQYFGTAMIEPMWNMDQQFVVEQHQTAYASDGVESSQPMTREVSNSQHLDSIGDTITYNKGGSIVRMMNLVFGPDLFQAVLQNYLKNHKEVKVARPENLWRELQNEINSRKVYLNASVDEIMTTWTEQAGYPVVTVTLDNQGGASVTQKRFLLRNLKSTPTNSTWWIPLTWSKDKAGFNSVQPGHWLSKEQDKFVVGNTGSSPGWVIFNVQSSGFYRVNYDNASWYRIIEALNSKNYEDIHVLNRAALVDDALNLARAGMLSYNTTLDTLRYLKLETNYLPFKSALTGLSYLDQKLSGLATYHAKFKEFVLLLIKNRYEQLGYVDRPSDDRLTVLLRAELNKWACNYGHEGCIQTFTNMFQQWRKDNTLTIKPNQRSVAYCMGVKYGTPEDWDFLWNQYFNSNSGNEQATILQALGCTTDSTILEKYLLSALQGFEVSRIRKQDCTSVFSAVYTSGMDGAELVMNFVNKYYTKMQEYDNGLGMVSSVLSSASQRFSTELLVDKFENLIQNRTVEFASILKSLQNALEIARYELWWFEENTKSVISWVDSFVDEETRAPENGTSDTTDYRLPKSLSPDKYTILIETNVDEAENFTFRGVVQINAVVVEKTRTIVLHSSDLVHENIAVLAGGKNVAIVKTNVKTKYDFLEIELVEELQVGQNVSISVTFNGYLNEDMRGFYRSSYVDDDGNLSWLAATHMEPVAARKLFPCFDEPAMKATFSIQVVIPKHFSAVSNMPIVLVTNEIDGKIKVSFDETPKMSTYLVALVVGNLSATHSGNYSVWSRPNAVNDTLYSLSVMEPLIKFYEKALSLPYQLPKMDMVALPDFVSGAMENWGLLTYKERYLMYTEDASTTASKQIITNVISHEITHQWFGDLVSPLWWKYLWLNEGFARYFQYHGTARIREDWNLEAQFVVEQVHSSLEADSSVSTHAMTHDVYSPTQIRGIFDTISYGKAASVIRMVEKTFGQDVFFKALHNYLEKRQYDVATPEDLFDAFKDQISDPSIKNSFHDIMNTWTTQPGYPVLHVTVEPNKLLVRQQRFILKPGTGTVANSTWYIPLTWTSLDNPNFNDTKPKFWIDNTQEATVTLSNSSDLILLNVQQSGFYRTNYDIDTWNRLIGFLKSDRRKLIHEINRAALVDDLLHFGRADVVDYSIVLSAIEYLANETSYLPWRAFFNGLSYLHKHMQNRDAFGAYKQYIKSLLTPIYDRLGFEDKSTDNHETKLFRSHVRKWACKLGASNCTEEALSHWPGTFIQNHPNYLSTVLCTVARTNSLYYWNRLWNYFITDTFSENRLIILQSMACATDAELVEDLLSKAISKSSTIRFEDSSNIFAYVMDSSAEGAALVMDFVEHNYDNMVKYYRKESDARSIVSAIGKRVVSRKLYDKYSALLALLSNKYPASRKVFESYKNDPAYEVKWSDNHVPKLHEWFETRYPWGEYRLPSTFSPERYTVLLSPRFEGDFEFTGEVLIEINRQADDVSRILLNSHKLGILKVTAYQIFANSTGEELEVTSVLPSADTQTLAIFTKNFITGDKVLLNVSFTGYLNNDMKGFYRSHYVNSDGKLRWLAATQFEPTFARQAFPCFDEPAMKATFNIHIQRPKDYVALSNMPVASTEQTNDSYVWVTFKETVRMSSYLVAFVVSDFQTVRSSDSYVQVWGRPEVAKKGDLAEVAALRLLEYLSSETGHKYGLPKLDLIGIPDFSMGAMENWGLVTFREYGLFYDKDVTTAKYKDYIITIIAHELSHMMFGNLVTCDWWEYIWLNEGFAELMQWVLSDLYQPFNGYDDLFVVNELQPALLYDASTSTHPMNNPVVTPSQINNVFDTVTYGKSSSVLRMLRETFGKEVYAKTIYRYLQKHQNGTTTPSDLWKIYDEEVKKDGGLGDWEMSMEELMDGWTNKPGYPIVDARLNSNTITLTQKNCTTYEDSGAFWIPITFTNNDTGNFENRMTNVWLGSTPQDIYVGKLKWFIVNVQQTGYYRVNYDYDSWTNLIEALADSNHSGIHVTNRAQIIDDLFNLARDGYVSYNVTLAGSLYLRNEMDYLPWKAFFNSWRFLVQRYENHSDNALLRKYVQLLASKVYKKLGFVDDITKNHHEDLNRELILTWMCRYEYPDCVETSKKLYKEWRTSLKNGISPNARPAVYCTAVKYGVSSDWHFLWEQYQKTQLATEKKVILDALGCSQNQQVLDQYIQIMLNGTFPSQIRKQDISAAFASIYNAGPLGVNTILDFLINDYKKLYDYYDSWDGVRDLISKVALRVSNRDQLFKLVQLSVVKDEEMRHILPTVQAAIKTAQKNDDWYKTYSPIIDERLELLIRTIETAHPNAAVNVQASSIFSISVFSIIVYILSH